MRKYYHPAPVSVRVFKRTGAEQDVGPTKLFVDDERHHPLGVIEYLGQSWLHDAVIGLC